MNFPPGKDKLDPILVGTAERQAVEMLQAYRHPFILKLIEHGVLPSGCQDFRLDAPLEGVITITATYLVDKDGFEKALRDYSAEPGT